MAVQNGKDLLIKVDMVGDGQFVTVAGLRATALQPQELQAIETVLAA